MQTDLRLIGSGSSPYTRKLRAAFRYRRIPYRFVIQGSKEQQALLLPVLDPGSQHRLEGPGGAMLPVEMEVGLRDM